MELFFLPLVLAYGALTSYYDLRYRIVPNWLTAAAVFTALLLYVAIIVKTYAVLGTVSWKFVADTVLNFVCAVILAYALFRYGAVGAGDGKMIIAYSLLLPVSLYVAPYTWPYPGFMHVVVSYALAYLYSVAVSVRHVGLDDFLHELRKGFNPRDLLLTAFLVLGFSAWFNVVAGFFGVALNSLVNVALILATFVLLGTAGRDVAIPLAGAGVLVLLSSVSSDPESVQNILVNTVVAVTVLLLIYRPFMSALTKHAPEENVPLAVFFFIGALAVFAWWAV